MGAFSQISITKCSIISKVFHPFVGQALSTRVFDSLKLNLLANFSALQQSIGAMMNNRCPKILTVR